MVWGALIQTGLQGHSANEGAEATVEATKADIYQKRLGLEEQQRQYDMMQKLMNPFYQSGQDALKGLEQNAQGFGNRLNEIMMMPEVQQIIADKTGSQTGQLRGMGLGRSGFGQKQLGGIASDTAMGFENVLNNRMQSLANQAQTSGMGLNSMNQANVNAQGNLLGQMGNSAARGAIMQGNFNQAGINSLVQGGANMLDYYR